MFLHLHNALFEHVPRVRASRLQKPNMKALHLHSTAYHWRRASISYDLLRDTSTELDAYTVETIGMDFMEAAIVSVYQCRRGRQRIQPRRSCSTHWMRMRCR